MIRPHTRRLSATSGRWLLTVLVGVGLGGVLPSTLHAQAPPTLVQFRLEYQRTLSTLDAALLAYEVAQSRFDQALGAVTTARASGDEDQHERALTVAQAAAQPVQSAERRVNETNEAVEDARALLAEALDTELRRMYAAEDTVPLEVLADLRITIVDMENELDGVRGSLFEMVAVPAILDQLRIDPNDGPGDILNKADLLERRAARHTEDIFDIDDRLTELRNRQRLERARRTARADRLRFDDSRVQIGPPGQAGTQSTPSGVPTQADTTGVPIRPQTTEEQIRGLEQLRERLVALRDQILERATQFRIQAGGEA